ncbi:hypothetical protein AB1286_08740 [Trinickia sp. NRRL B-1857]
MSHDTSSDGVWTSAGKRSAGSVFVGDRLPTTPNPTLERDEHLITRLGAR